MKKQNRIVLSALSVLLTLALLAGGSMAWFTDTEKVAADFSAGILDAVVTPENPNAEGAIDFTNLRPLRQEQLEAAFQSNSEKPVGNVPGEGFPQDNQPLYFQKVNIFNNGTLPMRVTLTIEPTDPCGRQIKKIVDNGTGGVRSDGTELCNNGLKDELQILLYQQDDSGKLTPVGAVATLWKDGAATAYVLPDSLAAQTSTDYILAAWLPENTTNASQAKHFHGKLAVSAAQTDAPTEEPSVPSPWDGETITPVVPDGNVYEISNGAEWAWIMQQANTRHDDWRDIETFMNKEIRQTADIDFGGHEIYGIGLSIDYSFAGTYDGQGHVLKNFTISRPDQYYVAPFNYVRMGTVKNLTVQDAIISGNSNVGGIVGYLSNGTVSNCKNYATVEKPRTSGGSGAGGIVGTAYGNGSYFHSTITDCYNYGTVRAYCYAGGILGDVTNGKSCVTLSGCVNEGTIESLKEPPENTLGGLAGKLNSDATVENCRVLDTSYSKAIGVGPQEGVVVFSK